MVVCKVRLRVLHSLGADCGASVGVEGDVRALLSGGWEGEGRDESLYCWLFARGLKRGEIPCFWSIGRELGDEDTYWMRRKQEAGGVQWSLAVRAYASSSSGRSVVAGGE